MKTTAIQWLAGPLLVISAQAGIETPTINPVPAAGLWEWFVGGSAGYLTDLEEGMYGLQFGMEYQNPGDKGSHAIFLEVGFTEDDASYSDATAPGPVPVGGRTENAEIDLNIIPITLNYKYQAPITERLGFYAGLGLGIAILDSSYDWSWSQALPPPAPSGGGGSDDETDARFYGDVFAGLGYDVSDSLEIYTGVRYIFMDETEREIDVTGASDYTKGINGDVLIELGIRYRF
jgi:opacity protein-like surface antigen